MKAEHLERRFGVIAIKKGFIKPEQLIEAMEIQIKEDIETGKHRLIGHILYEQQVITPQQIDEVLESLN